MILVLYVPALHQGYLELFAKYKTAETLYILDQDVIDEFPLTAREIRSIPPPTMRDLLLKANYFPAVELANKKVLADLSASKQDIILSNDTMADWLQGQYFSKHKVKQESIFLRYDEKLIKKARQEVEYTGAISRKQFDRQVMGQLAKEKVRSGDYFLWLAAAIIKEGQILAIDHNHRMPTEQEMHLVGDPRNFIKYGTDSHQRTVLHAEQALIAECARKGIPTDGASLYATIFPCPDCSQLIAKAGIKKLYFQGGYSQLSSTDIFKLFEIEVIKVI